MSASVAADQMPFLQQLSPGPFRMNQSGLPEKNGSGVFRFQDGQNVGKVASGTIVKGQNHFRLFVFDDNTIVIPVMND